MCQCRPADPMDPGDAADLSIMGFVGNDPPKLLARTSIFTETNSRARSLENQ
jgi:hypothetical protein